MSKPMRLFVPTVLISLAFSNAALATDEKKDVKGAAINCIFDVQTRTSEDGRTVVCGGDRWLNTIGKQKITSISLKVKLESPKPGSKLPEGVDEYRTIVLKNPPESLAYLRNYADDTVWRNPIVIDSIKKAIYPFDFSSVNIVSFMATSPLEMPAHQTTGYGLSNGGGGAFIPPIKPKDAKAPTAPPGDSK